MTIVAGTRRLLATVVLAVSSVLVGEVALPVAQAYSNVPIEILTVPSAAMGRDVHVEFLSGGAGSHALYLLDSMEAGDDRNGWDINTSAFDWYAGSWISVVMPPTGPSPTRIGRPAAPTRCSTSRTASTAGATGVRNCAG